MRNAPAGTLRSTPWSRAAALALAVLAAAANYDVNPVESEGVAGAPQTNLPNISRIIASLGTIADGSWDAERYAASPAAQDASQAAWDALRPALLASPPAP